MCGSDVRVRRQWRAERVFVANMELHWVSCHLTAMALVDFGLSHEGSVGGCAMAEEGVGNRFAGYK